MKKTATILRLALLAVGFSSVIVACSNNANESGTNADTQTMNANNATGVQTAVANLSGVYPDTTVNGTAQFTATGNGRVRMNLDITVPTKANQSVAVHIHENGNCADSAKAAGGHWNPTNTNHGKWGSGSFHAGDIGNVSLDGSGRGTMELETDLWSIGGDAQKNILNKSVVIHSGVDDYTSQPAGNSGNRIGCAIIMASSNQ